nr:MAG TPA: hypothetical protein [Caudoviricetes sp.]
MCKLLVFLLQVEFFIPAKYAENCLYGVTI